MQMQPNSVLKDRMFKPYSLRMSVSWAKTKHMQDLDFCSGRSPATANISEALHKDALFRWPQVGFVPTLPQQGKWRLWVQSGSNVPSPPPPRNPSSSLPRRLLEPTRVFAVQSVSLLLQTQNCKWVRSFLSPKSKEMSQGTGVYPMFSTPVKGNAGSLPATMKL